MLLQDQLWIVLQKALTDQGIMSSKISWLLLKGSNGEFRSQLYRCLDRKHIIQEKFDELYAKNITLGNKIMSFITYLQNSVYKGQRYKTKDTSQ